MTIPAKLTLEELDNYFQIATYVERYMPSPLKIKNRRTEMFLMIDRQYGISSDKDTYKGQDKPKMKIRLNGQQLQIYEFCILLMVKGSEKDRDIIGLRNFPFKRSFRELRKFFMPDSYEKVRQDYYKALLELLKIYNKHGYKYICK